MIALRLGKAFVVVGIFFHQEDSTSLVMDSANDMEVPAANTEGTAPAHEPISEHSFQMALLPTIQKRACVTGGGSNPTGAVPSYLTTASGIKLNATELGRGEELNWRLHSSKPDPEPPPTSTQARPLNVSTLSAEERIGPENVKHMVEKRSYIPTGTRWIAYWEYSYRPFSTRP